MDVHAPSRRTFLKTTVAGIAAARAVTAQPAAPARPNVVFVFADQWRAQATGYAGDPNVHTPALDALRATSVEFTHAVSTCPVCSPYRASLLTGQYPLTHGIFLNDVPLSPDAVTMGDVYQAAGYDTAYIGKWHLDGHGRSNYIPPERRQGFDYWRVLECTHSYNQSDYYADGPEKRRWDGYDAAAQTRDAQQYIAEHGREKPFLLVLSWGPPHNPYETAPEKYRALYNPETLTLRGNVPPEAEAAARKDLAGYYAHCSALDDCVAALLKTLADNGLAENTVFVFTSDHGDMLGSQGQQRKQRPWDEAVHVPFLLRYPKALGTAGRLVTRPIAPPDILPTLLGLCGIAKPESIEGQDHTPLLRGEEPDGDGAALIACYAPFGEWTRTHGGKEYRGIRTSRYTYVRDLAGPWLLYDNETDPFQLHNLVNSSEAQAGLDATLQEVLRKQKDAFLPGKSYVEKWGYKTDANGTVPYSP